MHIVALPNAEYAAKTRSARFRDAFLDHFNLRWFKLAETKSSVATSQPLDRVAHNQFFVPPQNVGYALVVDIDRPEAVLDVYDRIPAEIAPSWVVPTNKGAQAGWFIDPVNLTGHDHPIRYARKIGKDLRQALDGDLLVDPLTPSRVRNPAYEHAGTFASAAPPVYQLGQLMAGLKAAGLWTTTRVFDKTGKKGKPRVRLTPKTGPLDFGERNDGVFDASRFVAYAGGDYVTAAWAANERCVEPLSSSEINAIIRSIAGYMATEGYQRQGGGIVPMPDSMRQALAEMGRKGGLRNSHAQRAARAKGPAAAAAARKRRADDQARQAKHLHRKGHSRAQIAAKLGRAACTISRYLRRWLPLTEAEKRACITGASGERYALAPTTDTLRWTLSSHRPASNNNYRPQRVGPPQYLRWSRRSTNPRHST